MATRTRIIEANKPAEFPCRGCGNPFVQMRDSKGRAQKMLCLTCLHITLSGAHEKRVVIDFRDRRAKPCECCGWPVPKAHIFKGRCDACEYELVS